MRTSEGSEAHAALERNIQNAVQQQKEKLEETQRIANTVKTLYDVLSFDCPITEWKRLCGSDQAVKVSAVCEKVLQRMIAKNNQTP